MKRSPSTPLETFQSIINKRREHNLSSSHEAERSDKLDDDLYLASCVGQALLEENSELNNRIGAAETARDTLLDRLAVSYRDSATLERRVDQLQANLDAAESTNRSLLVTLEEDRKTINRLSIDAAKASSADRKCKALARERDDLRQELDWQLRRAVAAESRASRATDKLDAIEAKASLPGPRIAEDPHLNSSSTIPFIETPSKRKKARLRHSDSVIFRHASNVSESTEPIELLKLVESLVDQNTSLKAEVQEAQDMLDAAREDQQILRTELDNRSMHSDNEALGTARASFLSEMMLGRRSPSPSSPTLINSPGFTAPDALSAPSLYRSTSTTSSVASSDRDEPPMLRSTTTYGLVNSQRRKRTTTRPLSLSATPKVTNGKRRPQSADVTGLFHLADPHEIVHSPVLETIRDTSPVAERISAISYGSSNPTSPPGSPTVSKARRAEALNALTGNFGAQARITVDAAAQTDPELGSPFITTRTYANAQQTESRALSIASAEERIDDQNSKEQQSGEARTLALLSLIEHSGRLLGRLKSADVASLEARLKKQNLPGDVSLLAKSTVLELMADIEGLRELFRNLLEQERQKRTRDAVSTSDSLVTRRDFVSLVKLLRDILSELGRLRSIVNRVQLEPALGYKIAELDATASTEDIMSATSSGRSLLAPLQRLFSAPTLEVKSKPADKDALYASKGAASNAVAVDTVNVEFGSGVVKQAVMHNLTESPSLPGHKERSNTLKRKATHAALSNIFAGSRLATRGEWVTLRSAAPVGRQLASSAMPNAMSQTTNAVVDTFSGPQFDEQPTLLERTLRPRGLSDSSIRSTFVAHANPARIAPVKPTASLGIATADLENAILHSPASGPGLHAQEGDTNSTASNSQPSTPSAISQSKPLALKHGDKNSAFFGIQSLASSYVGSWGETRLRNASLR